MPKTLWYKITKSQVIRFLISASAGFVVDISSFYLLYHNLFSEPTYQILSLNVRNSTLSLTVSYILGVMVNFLVTKFFVFKESRTSGSKQFARFALVAGLGYFANLGVLTLMIKTLNMYPPLARILAALSLFVASYFVHKFFSFSLSLRKHHGAKPDHHTGN